MIEPLRYFNRALAALLLALPVISMGGTIALEPESRVEVLKGVPVVTVECSNSGDEQVEVLSAESLLGGDQVRVPIRRSVKPGDTIRQTIPFNRVPSVPGLYQVVTRLRGQAQNGVSFSAVAVADYVQGTARPDEWVVPTLVPLTMGRQGALMVQLMSIDGLAADITVRLVLPDEFTCDLSEHRIRLAPDAEVVESFELTSRCAVPGGVYPVAVVIESVADGMHRETAVIGTITVTEALWIGQSRWVWAGGGVLLVVLLLWLGWRSQAGGRGSFCVLPGKPAGTPCTPGKPAGTPCTPGKPAGTPCALDEPAGTSGTLDEPAGTSGALDEPAGTSGTLDEPAGRLFDAAILAVVTVFVAWQLSPGDWFRNTVTVGGDTPAHLYLVSHLKDQLFHHGRIVSWAGGWWCGFPMFQYYFVLPYLVAALLSVVIPMNIAFKLVSVAGLVMTPLCAWMAGRLWKLPRPVPVVLAVTMVPFLFVQSHTMWGVNTSSTLAGMIANSWSFALMLPALASACRDAGEGRFRLRTVCLLALLPVSHFFTSVMAVLSLAIVPVLCWVRPEHGVSRWASARRALRVLAGEGIMAALLTAWWWIPLMAKSAYSVDFGNDWSVALWQSFPAYAAAGVVLAGMALVVGTRGAGRSVWFLAWLALMGGLLFIFGFSLSPVFVNVRLWPFVFFALMALAAVGLGVLLERARAMVWPVVILTVAVLAGTVASDSITGGFGPGKTRAWAHWNYSGLESKPAAAVFERLVKPLQGTPGRLANDLCEENNQLGSSRVFELAPYLAGKPVLEGGLVNSALGSLYAYYVQGETSRSCAGFPPMVRPATFDFTRASRHLELFNVKHFIARSEQTQDALRRASGWKFVAREQEWELYEATNHAGRYVFVPPLAPVVVETTRWKECSLEWLYTIEALDRFAIWAEPGSGAAQLPGLVHQTEQQFLEGLNGIREGRRPAGEGESFPKAGTACIRDERVTDDRICFTTSALGRPHIVKVSWFPNWKVRGAAAVYRVSPGFMLVFPEQAEVELYYGTTGSDGVGYGLTVAGWVVVGWVVMRRRKIQQQNVE